MTRPDEFYDGLVSQYHFLFEDWWSAAVWHSGIVAKLLAARGVSEQSRILDCTCGIGTQALPLSALGYDVTGTDLSQRSIERARTEARARGLGVDLEVADIRRLREAVEGEFDAVISFDNALAHLLTDEDLDQAVGNVRSCLRPGGPFLASIRDYDDLSVARPSGTPIAMHGPKGARQGAGQAWAWSSAGDQVDITLFTLAESTDGTWHVAAHETTSRALRRPVLTAALTAHAFDGVQWLMPQDSGYYQPIVAAVATELPTPASEVLSRSADRPSSDGLGGQPVPLRAQLAPTVPPFDGDPGADPGPGPVRVRGPPIQPGQPVDVGQPFVVAPADDSALQADVGVPVGAVEHGQADPRICPQIVQSSPACVHVDQHLVSLQQVPGRHADGLAVGTHTGDDGGLRLGEKSPDPVGQRSLRHALVVSRSTLG